MIMAGRLGILWSKLLKMRIVTVDDYSQEDAPSVNTSLISSG